MCFIEAYVFSVLAGKMRWLVDWLADEMIKRLDVELAALLSG